MEKSSSFIDFLEEKLMPVASRLSEQRHLKSIRDGIMSTIPLTIIGGICLILAFPPVDPSRTEATNFFKKFLLGWHSWANNNIDAILTPFNMTMAIMALFAAMAIAYSLAKEYQKQIEIDPLSSAVISGVVFLLVAAPAVDGGIPTTYLDAKGLFTAMMIGLLTVEITKSLLKRGVTIKMPEGVPPAVSSSFTSLIPMVINVILFYGINLILISTLESNIPESIMRVLSPALNAADSLWLVLFMIIIAHLLWFVGVHGAAIIMTVLDPFFTQNILANAGAKVAGQPMEFVWTGPLWSLVVTLGGSGATLALAVLMLRSKSSQLKTVGRVGILPGLFNINEPILFGTPLILNPMMIIPLVLAPSVNGIIGYLAIKSGLIGKAYVAVPWTTPAFIGLPLATVDWKAFLLVVLVFFIDIVIYYPFFKSYEKILIEEEKASEAA